MINQIHASYPRVSFKSSGPRRHPGPDHGIVTPHKILEYMGRYSNDGDLNYVYTHRPGGRPLPDYILEKTANIHREPKDIASGVQVLPIVKAGEPGKEKDHIMLIPIFRVPLEGLAEVSIETPGGTIEEGQDIITGAKKELKEETGYRLRANGEIEILTPMISMSPASESEINAIVKVKGLEKIDREGPRGENETEKRTFLGDPLLVPVDNIYEQLNDWTENGIQLKKDGELIDGGRKFSCIVFNSVYSAVGFLMRDLLEKEREER